MAGELPDGFSVDQAPPSAGSLPAGFSVDSLPSGFSVDQPPQEVPAPQPQPQSLISRMSKDYSDYNKNQDAIAQQENSGKIGAFPAEYEKASNAAKLVFVDPITGLAKATGEDMYNRASPERQQQLQSLGNTASGAITSGVNYLKQGAQDLGTAEHYYLGDNLMPDNAIDKAQQYYNNSPNLQAMTNGTMNFANALPMAGAEEKILSGAYDLAKPAIKGVASSAGNSSPGAFSKFASSVITPPQEAIDKIVKETGMLTGDQVNDITAHRYNTAYSLGANVNPTGTGKIIDTISDMNPINKGAAATRGSGSTMQGVLSRWDDQLRGRPLTIHDLDGMNKELGDMIQTKPDGSLTNDGRQVLKSQSKLREMMLNPAETDVDGGTQGFQQLSKATKTAAIGFKVGDIEDIVNASANANQPEQYMKQRFRNILNNGNAAKAYSPDEISLMKEIVNSNLSDEIKRGVGSRALPMLVAGTTGKLGDAAIASLAGIGSRNAAFSARLYKVAELRNAITSKLPDLAPVAGQPPIRSPIPHPSAAGFNPGTNPIPASMNAGFVRSPSPTDLGPVGNASIPGQASFASKPNPTDLGYTGGASIPGPAGYIQEPHPNAAGYRGSPVNVGSVANAANPRPSYGAVGNLGFGKPIGNVNLPIEDWPGYAPKQEGQKSGGRIKGKIAFKLQKSKT